MKNPFEKEPLEVRLIKMPFDRMTRAIEAIDDLDDLLLERLKIEGTVSQQAEWSVKVALRKEQRQKFIAFRMAAEVGIGPVE